MCQDQVHKGGLFLCQHTKVLKFVPDKNEGDVYGLKSLVQSLTLKSKSSGQFTYISPSGTETMIN